MYCEIVLSQRFPKSMGIFDYKIPDELHPQIKIGHLVTIPFRAGKREGVVIKLKKTTDIKKTIKSITAIAQPEPILTPAQIKLADWMSRYYFVSIGTVIKMILPNIPKKSSKKRSSFPPTSAVPNSGELQKITTEVLKDAKPSIVWYAKQNQREAFYQSLFESKKKVLVLVPTILDMQKLARLVPQTLEQKTALVHSKLNKNEYYELYQNILQKKTQIIIGTKLALFMPIPDKTMIVIDQEENNNHKQSDQNPRYDARLTAEILSTHTNSKLIFTSHAPSVVRYQQNHNDMVALPPTTDTAVTTIDMREEFKKQHYSIFSETLTESIEQTLAQNKKVLLFINKRGTSSSVVCKDCGDTLSCEICTLPYVYHEKNESLYCHRCNKKSEVPPFCPKCNGTNFKFSGTGTQKVEREAVKQWPDQDITRFDKDTDPEVPINKHNIIVGTERVFDYLDWDQIGCVGVVSADTFLHLPDFRSSERTMQLLSKIKSFGVLSIVVQTYSPDNQAIKHITANAPEKFYQAELTDRKIVHYPPFAGLIKLIFQHKNKDTCLKESERLFQTMKTSPLDVKIMTPLQPYLNNKWRMYLVLKYDLNQKKVLNSIMDHVPDTWIIDRDPDTLL